MVVASAKTTTSTASGSALLGEERVLTWVDGPEEGDGVPGCGGEQQPGEGLSYDKSSLQRPTHDPGQGLIPRKKHTQLPQ